MRGIRNIGLWLVLVLAVGAVAASAALATSVGLMAWGYNAWGQVGDGTTVNRDKPVKLSTPTDVVGVAGGENFSLALLDDGTVMSWGENFGGQLGDGSYEDSAIPVAVSGLSGVTAISGGYWQDLALKEDGTVYTLGGTGALPEKVEGLSKVKAIAAGAFFDLALLADGTAVSWGYNDHGQLGNGTTTNSWTPVEVKGLNNVTAITAGYRHSLALLEGGKVVAWGEGESGELGDGSEESSDVPVEVKGLGEEVAAIEAGDFFSVAALKGGTVVAWGANGDGQLGDGTTTSREEPVKVTGLGEVVSVAAGDNDGLALTKNGVVLAWGKNEEGELGDGTTTGPETCGGGACSRTPVTVGSLTEGVAGIAAGGGHNLAFATGPIVGKLEPATGTPLGGTVVLISGLEFHEVAAVKFGSTNASSYEVVSPTLIKAVAPVGKGATHVTVTTLKGSISTSATGMASRYMYVTALAPEFGRCNKVTKGTGKYSSASCIGGEPEGAHEWTPGVTKTHFTLSGGEGTLETVAKTKIVCKSESGSGEYSGTKKVKGTALKLTGCESAGAKCTTSGATTGEIVTSSLEGKLGWKDFESGTVALDLFPTGETGPVAEFSCASITVAVRGSVLVTVETNNMAKETTLKYEQSSGKQKPESFEGEPKDVLETSFSGGSYEQTGLAITTTMTSEEEVEVNAAV